MYNRLVLKMRSHLGPASLIIYSKHFDYYRINPIKKDDFQMYYYYLMPEKGQRNQNLINDITCCLNYLPENNETYKDKYTSLIIKKLDIYNEPINDKFLTLIYNVIDFVQNHLKFEKDKLEFLLWYLERFSSLSKIKQNFYYLSIQRGFKSLIR